MKKLRLFIAALLTTAASIGGMLAVTAPAHALFEGAKEQACNGAELQASGGCTSTTDHSNDVSTTLRAILNILSFVVGVVAVIMLMIGGIRFVTSQGDGSSTALARNTIIYALVGIVVAVLAQFMVQFVIGRATGNNPTSSSTTTQNADGSTTTTSTTQAGTTTTTTRNNPDGSTTTTTNRPDGTTSTCITGQPCVIRQ